MKMSWPFALAFVAVAVFGLAAVMLAASTPVSAGPVPASGSQITADPLADLGEFDAAVPVACIACRSLTNCSSEGQKCDSSEPNGHCRCSTCNGILTCRPR